MAGSQASTVLVSGMLAQLIDAMREQLRAEFGVDCAFTIMGRGEIIAASNLADGEITAQSR